MMYRMGHIFGVYAILVIVTFLLHTVWERLHIRLYTDYDAMRGRLPVYINASIGDVLYTLLAVLIFALLARDPLWFLAVTGGELLLLAILGFFIALFVEYKAMRLKRWRYLPAMPKVFGFGLSPLVQMTVLLPLSVCICMIVATRFLGTMPV